MLCGSTWNKDGRSQSIVNAHNTRARRGIVPRSDRKRWLSVVAFETLIINSDRIPTAPSANPFLLRPCLDGVCGGLWSGMKWRREEGMVSVLINPVRRRRSHNNSAAVRVKKLSWSIVTDFLAITVSGIKTIIINADDLQIIIAFKNLKFSYLILLQLCGAYWRDSILYGSNVYKCLQQNMTTTHFADEYVGYSVVRGTIAKCKANFLVTTVSM